MFEQSAEKGYAYAQRSLGRAYHFGLGVPKDLERAIGWYDLAASNGDPQAQELAARVRTNLGKRATN